MDNEMDIKSCVHMEQSSNWKKDWPTQISQQLEQVRSTNLDECEVLSKG